MSDDQPESEKNLPVKESTKRKKRDSGNSSGIDYDRVIAGVVEQLKPQMDQTIKEKSDSILDVIKKELQDIRGAMKQPMVNSGGNFDIQGLLAQAKKEMPFLESMLPAADGLSQPQQQQPTNQKIIPAGLENANIKWGSDYVPANQGQPQQQPGQINMGGIMQLLQVAQQLGLMPNPATQQNTAALQTMVAFQQLAMNNAMADMGLGSFIRKTVMTGIMKQNPMLAPYAEKMMSSEEALIGKPLDTISGLLNPQQSQQQQQQQQQVNQT